MKTLFQALCILLLAFIFAMEVRRDISSCDCVVDCCCDTPSACETATATNTRLPTSTATFRTATNTPATATVVRPTQSPTLATHTYAPPTATPALQPTATISNTTIPPTVPACTPTVTVTTCYQWLCHKPDTAAEQDYCCDSDGCVDAHLGHGDYLGRCK